MSRKLLILSSTAILLLVNSLIVGTLYFSGIIFQPTKEQLEAQRLAAEAAAKAAQNALKYAHLEPLPAFKSKAKYISSIGEAMDICAAALHEKEPARKSWSINHIDSRYLHEQERYIIFLDYVTIVPVNVEPKIVNVTCEVEGENKQISNWKAMKEE